MELQELKDKLIEEPFSLIDDKLFYVVEANMCGIRLQGRLSANKLLPLEVRSVLSYDKDNGWLTGRYRDEDTSFETALT